MSNEGSLTSTGASIAMAGQRSRRDRIATPFNVEPSAPPLLRKMHEERASDAAVFERIPRHRDLAEGLRTYLEVAGVKRTELFTTDETRKGDHLPRSARDGLHVDGHSRRRAAPEHAARGARELSDDPALRARSRGDPRRVRGDLSSAHATSAAPNRLPMVHHGSKKTRSRQANARSLASLRGGVDGTRTRLRKSASEAGKQATSEVSSMGRDARTGAKTPNSKHFAPVRAARGRTRRRDRERHQGARCGARRSGGAARRRARRNARAAGGRGGERGGSRPAPCVNPEASPGFDEL
jgi:hypothetical protein